MAGNLSAGSVDGSSESSPESDEVGAHVPAASRVNLPQTGVCLVGGLVEALVLRHLVLGVDQAMAKASVEVLQAVVVDMRRR